MTLNNPKLQQNSLPSVLVIAGFDPSGGAGVLSDCKSIHAHGGYAISAMTAVTVQNTQGVKSVEPVSAKLLQAQLEALAEDIQFDVIKIGMLANSSQIEVITRFLQAHPNVPCIYDPVLVSSSGKLLLDKPGQKALFSLFPKLSLLTPNLPEMDTILSLYKLESCQSSTLDSKSNRERWCQLPLSNLLIKGGHQDNPTHSVDTLISRNLSAQSFNQLYESIRNAQNPSICELHIKTFSQPRLSVQHNHGTGCTLASAIAVNLAKQSSLEDSIYRAKAYLQQALNTADLAQPNFHPLSCDAKTNEKMPTRHGSLNHFFDYFKH